jgi:hypothetical protein
MESVMMKEVFLFLIIVLQISCSKSQSNNISKAINSSDNSTENNSILENENFGYFSNEIDFEIENIEMNNKICIGDVIITVPDDYSIGFFNGDKYEGKVVHNTDSERKFIIMTFNKNNQSFDGADSSYISTSIPQLQNFINGQSDDMSLFYGQYRRNVYNNIKVAERLLVCQHEIINMGFNRQISFVYYDIVYVFTIIVDNMEDIFINEMSEYFEVKKGYFSNMAPYGWVGEKLHELYNDYENYNNLPIPIEKLFSETNLVFNTIKIKKKKKNIHTAHNRTVTVRRLSAARATFG